MGDKLLIMGESGRGKSTSLRNLDSEKTAVIRVLKKPLPFEGWKKKYKLFDKETKEGNMFDISAAVNVVKCLKYISQEMKHITNVIVDDAGTIMSLELFDKSDERGYDKFTQVAKNMKTILMTSDELREDLFSVFMFHVEENDFNGFKKLKAKTSGKMLDNAIGVESLFTVVLQADILKKGKDDVEHVFTTKSDGSTTVKSPIGMFDDKYIPNDLQFVLDKIKEYNEG